MPNRYDGWINCNRKPVKYDAYAYLDAPPTQSQLTFLRGLGHKGLPPQTKRGASMLIDKILSDEKSRRMVEEEQMEHLKSIRSGN